MMSLTRKVEFHLAPLVHLYKRLEAHEEPAVALRPNWIESDFMAQPSLPSSPQQQPLSLMPSPLPLVPPLVPELPRDSLKIEIPWSSLTQHDGPTPPPYDNSPLSPRSHREIQTQREHELETRKQALDTALLNFQSTITPASVVGTERDSPVSPLALISNQ
jgi:hypothetical protein